MLFSPKVANKTFHFILKQPVIAQEVKRLVQNDRTERCQDGVLHHVHAISSTKETKKPTQTHGKSC